jgi:uncharacterized protein involved in exopolysaccharide biosynthesis
MSGHVRERPPIASLIDFFRAIRRGWWIIGLSTLIGTAVAMGVAYTLPVTFRAEVLLQPSDDETPKTFGGLAAPPCVGVHNDLNAAEAQATV